MPEVEYRREDQTITIENPSKHKGPSTEVWRGTGDDGEETYVDEYADIKEEITIESVDPVTVGTVRETQEDPWPAYFWDPVRSAVEQPPPIEIREAEGLAPCTCMGDFRDHERPSVDADDDLTGHYDVEKYTFPGGSYQSGTVQINQVGHYIHGWYQLEWGYPATSDTFDTVTDQSSHIPTAHSIDEKVFRGILRKQSGTSYSADVWMYDPEAETRSERYVRAELIADVGGTVELGLKLKETVTVGHSFDFHDFSATYGEGDVLFHARPADRSAPRLDDESLRRLARASDFRQSLLYQQEARPLRDEQIAGIHRFVRGHLGRKVQAAKSGETHMEAPQLIRHINTALYPHPSDEEPNGLKLPNHGCSRCQGPELGTDGVKYCQCATLIREDQRQLAEYLLVNALFEESAGGGSRGKTIADHLYEIEATPNVGVEVTDINLPLLPDHLVHERYECEMEFLNAKGFLGGDESKSKCLVGNYFCLKGKAKGGLTVGARFFKLTMDRQIKEGGAWTTIGSATFYGVMAISKLSAKGSAKGKKKKKSSSKSSKGGSVVKPKIETGGMLRFTFETYLNWSWEDFDGRFEIFSGQANVQAAGYSWQEDDTIIQFYEGETALTARMNKIQGKQELLDVLEATASVSISILVGWMERGESSGEDPEPNLEAMSEPSTDVTTQDTDGALFPTNVASLPRPAYDDIGFFLAKHLALLQSPQSTLTVAGHTSRLDSWYHNQLLSVYRAKYALEAILEIAGDKMELPVERYAEEGRGGTRLLAEGERRAARYTPNSADGDNVFSHRRVDVVLNGHTALTVEDGRT